MKYCPCQGKMVSLVLFWEAIEMTLFINFLITFFCSHLFDISDFPGYAPYRHCTLKMAYLLIFNDQFGLSTFKVQIYIPFIQYKILSTMFLLICAHFFLALRHNICLSITWSIFFVVTYLILTHHLKTLFSGIGVEIPTFATKMNISLVRPDQKVCKVKS
jgi:hypothetical protein